ncbi:PADRE domain [Dillenia turbinata]|uniref:PADRE domain n=1 Tax=Dillenia turbinata TaxID=194707 RepID=A0AAN8V8X5_9MAGN
MGACASTSKSKTSDKESSSELHRTEKTQAELTAALRWPTRKVKVIHADGKLQEFNSLIRASLVTSLHPNYFLCSSESMSVGTCPSRVADDEELQSDHIYFLMPLSRLNSPLTLPDLCDLAIKASSKLTKDEVHSSR